MSKAAAGTSRAPRAAGKCPICGKPRSEAFRPFCSKRCADIDLSRWLSGVYAVPGVPSDEAEDTPSPRDFPPQE